VPPDVAGTQPSDWLNVGPADVDTSEAGVVATDNWPFLYLREPMIPALNMRWMIMVLVLSLAILLWYAPVRSFKPDGQMFFLGAGFMLLETKGVVQMALLFGSTWLVNSIIFFAILVMILGSNLVVLRFQPRKGWRVLYGLLIATLLINRLIPIGSYLGLAGMGRTIVSSALVFLPLFFAGIIFAMAFRDSPRPDIALGSNIAGVILGGLCENLSLLVGFNSLQLVAVGFYLLAAVAAGSGLTHPVRTGCS
jgi:hypothetical protein